MHRDIRPGNIIFDAKQKKVQVIDWGIAEFYVRDTDLNTRVSSRPYKSPEILLNYQKYDFAIDIWSLGCVMASMIFKVSHLFLEKNDSLQLKTLVKFFGYEELDKVIRKYNMENVDLSGVEKSQSKQSWQDFVTTNNHKLCSLDALDLLQQMLKFDFSERITAKRALEHSYFDSVRNFFE